MLWHLLSPALAGCLLALSCHAARGDEPLYRLREKRLRVAQDTFEGHWKLVRAGRQEGDMREVYDWSVRFLKAEQALAPTVGGKVRALVSHLKRMTELEAIAKLKYDAGALGHERYTATVFYRLEAEVWIAEAKEREKAEQ
jgi:hypothetical protein